MSQFKYVQFLISQNSNHTAMYCIALTNYINRQNHFSMKPTAPLIISLLESRYHKYQQHPEQYLLEKVQQLSLTINQSTFDKWKKLLLLIGSKYENIEYHNLTHGFDVMVTLDYFVTDCKMNDKLRLAQEERLYMLLAAYSHDVGHMGFTNAFYTASNDDLAVKYYFNSPLENMHAANLCEAIRMAELEIQPQKKRMMVQMILMTDNIRHQKILTTIKEMKLAQNQQIQNADKQFVMGVLLHAADINNPAKEMAIMQEWTTRLYQQFQKQHFKELELKIIPNVPLINSSIAKTRSIIGFIDHLTLPLYKQLENKWKQFGGVVQRITTNLQELRKKDTLMEIQSKKDEIPTTENITSQ